MKNSDEGGRLSAVDPYRITDQLNDEVLDVIVTRLEARGAHAFFQEMLRDYLDAMQLGQDENSRILDPPPGADEKKPDRLLPDVQDAAELLDRVSLGPEGAEMVRRGAWIASRIRALGEQMPYNVEAREQWKKAVGQSLKSLLESAAKGIEGRA